MKITSNSQLLSSLTALVDPTQKQQQSADQQQALRENRDREERVRIRDQEREQQIQQNRDALQQVQQELRARNLEKLRASQAEEGDEASQNLNLRESISGNTQSQQPAFTKLGQLVDIRV